MFTFGFYLSPAVLWLILFLVARRAGGERSFSTLFFVSMGIFAVSLVSAIYIPQYTIIVTPVVCVLAIRRFCYIGWVRSIIVTVLYLAWMMAVPILFDKAVR